MTAASAAERLAVLLAAGIPPTAAWTFTTGESASDVPTAMRARGWAELAAAWTVALAAGAPLAPALRGIAHGLRDADQARRDIAAELAGPVATARLVLALPVVGILFGVALGFDTIRTLFLTPLGWLCLAVAGALLLLAALWNRALTRRAPAPVPGLGCDLIAVGLGGGQAIAATVREVEAAAATHGIAIDFRAAREALALSERAGVPAIALLRSSADEERSAARSDARAAAARLGVRLMLPVGLCVLPAFFAVGVVPLLATVIGATLMP